MTLATNELQRAIFARLTTQLDMPVYDHVPQDSKFPYVMIGADTSMPWTTKTEDGQEFTCTIHAWDAPKAGRKSVKAVMERIYAALHRQEGTIPLNGHQLVEIRCEFTESYQESAEGASDRYYHGVMRFRALVRTV